MKSISIFFLLLLHTGGLLLAADPAEWLPSGVMAAKDGGMYVILPAMHYYDSGRLGSSFGAAAPVPESLARKNFEARKAGDLPGILALYGEGEATAVRGKYADVAGYPQSLAQYTDIEFVGKVSAGALTRLRFNMIGGPDVRPFPMVQYTLRDGTALRMTLMGENEGYLSKLGRGHFVNLEEVTKVTEQNAKKDFQSAFAKAAYHALCISGLGSGAISKIVLLKSEPAQLDELKSGCDAMVLFRYERFTDCSPKDMQRYNKVVAEIIAECRKDVKLGMLEYFSERDRQFFKRFKNDIPPPVESVIELFSNVESYVVDGVIRDADYTLLALTFKTGEAFRSCLVPFRNDGETLKLFYRDGSEWLRSVVSEPRVAESVGSVRK